MVAAKPILKKENNFKEAARKLRKEKRDVMRILKQKQEKKEAMKSKKEAIRTLKKNLFAPKMKNVCNSFSLFYKTNMDTGPSEILSKYVKEKKI